jgi:hypothetical protein
MLATNSRYNLKSSDANIDFQVYVITESSTKALIVHERIGFAEKRNIPPNQPEEKSQLDFL